MGCHIRSTYLSRSTQHTWAAALYVFYLSGTINNIQRKIEKYEQQNLKMKFIEFIVSYILSISLTDKIDQTTNVFIEY